MNIGGHVPRQAIESPKLRAVGSIPTPSAKRKESLYGDKPTSCPERFERCGQCNIYPCAIGTPSMVDLEV